MGVRWRAALVAASTCLPETAVAQERNRTAGEAVATTVTVSSPGEGLETNAEHVHDRTARPVVEEQAPAID